ncbi:MAG: quinone-dependent dihydroorotate dehydrogenase [Rhodospirillaceae bacterium]|nr:quinone-dependent dihydroorotate dehydrogenase [Rhodospirillaceae bacterium]
MDWYRAIFPLLRRLEPETAHWLALCALDYGLVPAPPVTNDPILASHVFGLDFANPIGLAAGFDKNARVFDAMLAQGFGFVEIGGVTPLPQPGNPRPRLFRLDRDRAVINRMGFNNDGLDAVAARLAARRGKGPIGANLANNTGSADAIGDFVALVRCLAGLADFLVVDISCPNTANGRQFQQPGPLADLLARVRAEPPKTTFRPVPILVKVAPDMNETETVEVLRVILAHGVDGIVICNTTIDRPDTLTSDHRTERGGLSGRPLAARALALLRRVYLETGGTVPLVGVGGIESGADAYARIRAGASLVQLYTAMVFEGPGLVRRIRADLADHLRRDGFDNVGAAVGADHRK